MLYCIVLFYGTDHSAQKIKHFLIMLRVDNGVASTGEGNNVNYIIDCTKGGSMAISVSIFVYAPVFGSYEFSAFLLISQLYFNTLISNFTRYVILNTQTGIVSLHKCIIQRRILHHFEYINITDFHLSYVFHNINIEINIASNAVYMYM